ncbi:MAG: tape measure protein [Micrococcus sp.]|nr:tape measure protein [Micrococcus sp.]
MKRSAILSVRILGDAKSAAKAFGDTEKKAGLLSRGLKGLGKGAAITAGAMAAGVGVALAKGFGRLTAIENAQAKMRGLGHDSATVETIMGNALASVKGTAYGLDDAATAAAGAVAAGIKPGAELEGVLKSVTNSAAASGSTMAEMGQIYNKVAGSNKAQNDVLSQVANRGIPIYAALADVMGVTQDAVFDLASKGKVDFKTFEKAMTQASGTVAEELGRTTTGAISNFGAAVSRFGATMLRGFLPLVGSGFSQATAMVDALGDVVGPVSDAIGARLVDAATRAGTVLQELTSHANDLYGLFSSSDLASVVAAAFNIPPNTPLHAALVAAQTGAAAVIEAVQFGGGKGIRGSLAEAFGWSEGHPLLGFLDQAAAFLTSVHDTAVSVASSFMSGFAPALDAVSTAFGQLVAGGPAVLASISPVGALFTALLPLLPQVAGLLGTVAGAVVSVLAGIVPLAATLMGALIPAVTQIGAAFLEVATTVVTWLAPQVEKLAGAVIPLLSAAIGVVVPVITTLAHVLSQVLIPGVNAVMPIVLAFASVLLDSVVGAVNGVTKVLTGAVALVGALFRGDWAGVWNAAVQIVTGVLQTLWNVVNLMVVVRVVGLVRGGLSAVLGIFRTSWQSILTGARTALMSLVQFVRGNLHSAQLLFTRALTTIRTAVTAALQAVVTTIRTALTSALTTIRNIWDSITGLTRSAWNGVTSIVNGSVGRVLSKIGSIPGKVRAFFNGAGNWLKDAGKNIVQGLLNGAGSILPTIGNFFLDKVPGFIKGPFKKALGIHSPSRVFASYGRHVVEGVEVGAAARQSNAARAIRSVAGTILTAGQRTLSKGLMVPAVPATAPGSGRGQGGGDTINVNVEVGPGGDPVEVGRQIVKAIKRYKAATS